MKKIENAQAYHLCAVSFLMLFVELTLIRWVGSNIYYIFFFTNFILLASFLGMSIGFLQVKSSRHWFRISPIILSAVIIFCYLNSYEYSVKLNSITENLDYSAKIFKNNLYPLWFSLPICFVMVVVLMATIANEAAKLFRQFPPLKAYRLEILGSLLGIIFFSLISLFHMSPLFWGMVICLLYIPLLWHEYVGKKYGILFVQISMLALMMFTFAIEVFHLNHYWSAYYKIELQEYKDKRYVVNVNGLPQQIIESVNQRVKVKPFYLIPYLQTNTKFKNILIIGAGTGGDVALALAQGAKRVDAVEIDKTLYELGKKFNPNHPYDDPRVHVYIEDGRSFLQRHHEKYDMIIFALTDSLHLISGQSSLRLENYLYTFEGFQIAREHLMPDGIFVLYNYYGVKWLVDRLANTLSMLYGNSPCLVTYSASDYWATVLSVSHHANILQCHTRWQSTGASYELPVTDDRPFMYLKDRGIPLIYSAALLMVSIIVFFSFRVMKISLREIKKNSHLFLMGCAFFLLETKNIVNYALFFGSTWFVNALVFMGILFTVYLSIEITLRYRIRKKWLCYLGLILSLLIAWCLPNSFILSLPIFLRFIVATILAFSPIFIANLIFAEQFRQTFDSTQAFGVNLLGAVLGGVLEYSSLLIGYQNIILLVMFIYLLGILCIVKLNRTAIECEA